MMLDAELLKLIAAQLKTSTFVIIGGKSAPVRRTSSQRLKTVAFSVAGHSFQAIEQNSEKPSRRRRPRLRQGALCLALPPMNASSETRRLVAVFSVLATYMSLPNRS